MFNYPSTRGVRARLRSDRGAISGTGLLVAGLVAFLALWSQGTLAPVAGSLPGGPQYTDQAGNDFANGFRSGYGETRCRLDWVEEDPADCPHGQGDNYIAPEDRGSNVAAAGGGA